MEKHQINHISDSQAIYLTNLEYQLKHAARQVARIKATTIGSPSLRIKTQIVIQRNQPNLTLFLQDLDRAARLCPMTEMNLAFQAQVLGYDPAAFIQHFLSWYDGSGYVEVITEKEALAIVQRDLAIEGRLPWEAKE